MARAGSLDFSENTDQHSHGTILRFLLIIVNSPTQPLSNFKRCYSGKLVGMLSVDFKVRRYSHTDNDCVSPAEVAGKLMPSAETCDNSEPLRTIKIIYNKN